MKKRWQHLFHVAARRFRNRRLNRAEQRQKTPSAVIKGFCRRLRNQSAREVGAKKKRDCTTTLSAERGEIYA